MQKRQCKVFKKIKSLGKSVRIIAFNTLINGAAGSYICPKTLRFGIYCFCKMKVFSSNIAPKNFFGSRNITIGHGSFINYQCFFDTSALITIEDHVHIGMRCCFITSTHRIGTESCRGAAVISKPITIETGCWIGSNVTILPGVCVRKGTIVAAGAVVTKDCEPNCVYAGVPAIKKRILSINEISL